MSRSPSAVQNVGPQMKFVSEGYDLPLTFSGGLGVQAAPGLLLSADLKHRPYDSETSFSAGAEFSPVSLISLRAGYLAGRSNSTAAGAPGAGGNPSLDRAAELSGLGAGIGFKFGSSAIDYSFTPAGELGDTQRVSLAWKF